MKCSSPANFKTIKTLLVIFACLAVFLISCTSIRSVSYDRKQGVSTKLEFLAAKEQKGEFLKYMDAVYVGMPKEDLYDVFGRELQKGYFSKDNEEWITFSDQTIEEKGTTVTFYVENGKVIGWKQEQKESTVEVEKGWEL